MAFVGFTHASAEFFARLADNNSRQYFTEHRSEYDRVIRQPMEDLLGEVESRYGTGHVMRPNRDVRFSPDKTPYRTNAAMWAGAVGGVYLTVSATGIEAGGGLYDPSRDQLERARRAIDSVPLAAAELSDTLAALRRTGFELAGPALKTAPRGYDRDHPLIELLRLKHYAVTAKLPIDASASDIWRTWERVELLISWASARVGAASGHHAQNPASSGATRSP